MFYAYNKTSGKFILLAIVSAMVLLAYFGSQTMSVQHKNKTHKESSSLNDTTTTNTTLVEVTTTVPEVTTTTELIVDTTVTTRAIIRTTTTELYISTTSPVEISDRDGPPHNTSTLVGCISWYESNWGADPNVFQFEQRTWEAYGGTGSPSNAPYWRQEQVFWLAWGDDGYHHWAAQKGRCF